MQYDFELTWKESLLRILEKHYPEWVSLSTIYSEIGDYRILTNYEKEPWREGKFQLRYENKIRTVLSDMAEERLVEKMEGEAGLWKRDHLGSPLAGFRKNFFQNKM